jgi:membrane-bound ClpP family serine protease
MVTKVEKENPAEGYVKVSGEHWKAESENQEPLKLDGKVTVVAVRSNVLVVKV